MKLQFIGAARVVTGSCYLLETNGQKILIDCGLYQGTRQLKERNYNPFSFDVKEISYCLLTHAHTDHTGLVPKLYQEGYKGPVITTSATVELCKIMLPDSGHIQEMEVERKNRKRARAGQSPLTPIYTAEEAVECVSYFKGVEYEEKVELFPGLQVIFHDAGHILGSSMLEIIVTEGNQEKRLVFSGDIGNTHQPFIHNPSCITDVDYIIMESTYGNRLHEDSSDRLERLKDIINETYNRGGNLVIPAFAIERTQDLLYYLNLLYDKKAIPVLDVYIDSPLAVAATHVFQGSSRYFDVETKELIAKGEDPLNLPRLHLIRTVEESQSLNEINGKAIIISASGMADAGRIKHHLKHNLWRSDATVLFVGYQAEGTLGRRLVNGEQTVKIHGEEIAVNAHIEQIDGFSAHADQLGLLNWLQCTGQKAKQVILVHGEPDAQAVLAAKIKEQMGLEPLIPALGEIFEWTETGISRSAPDTEAIISVEPEPEAMHEAGNQHNFPGHQTTHSDVNKALMRLRRKIKELMERDRKKGNLDTVLKDLSAITDLVEAKLKQGR